MFRLALAFASTILLVGSAVRVVDEEREKLAKTWPPSVEEQAEQQTEKSQINSAYEEADQRAIKNPQLAVKEAMARALDRAAEREEKMHKEEEARFADHPEHDMDHPNMVDYEEYHLDHYRPEDYPTHRDDPEYVDPHEDPDADLHAMPGQENDHGYGGYEADYHYIDAAGAAEEVGGQHFGTGEGVGRRRSRRRFRRRRQFAYGSSIMQTYDYDEHEKDYKKKGKKGISSDYDGEEKHSDYSESSDY